MYDRSAASASSSSDAGEAAARLDQRDQAAAGHVQPLQRPLEVQDDLVGQPVVAVVQQQPVVAPAPAPRRPRCAAPRCRARARWCAGPGSGRPARGSRPASRTRRPARAPAGRRPAGASARPGPRDGDLGHAAVPVEPGRHVPVADLVVGAGLVQRGQLDPGRVRAAGRSWPASSRGPLRPRSRPTAPAAPPRRPAATRPPSCRRPPRTWWRSSRPGRGGRAACRRPGSARRCPAARRAAAARAATRPRSGRRSSMMCSQARASS